MRHAANESSRNAARVARARAKRLGLRLAQRGNTFNLVDGDGSQVHSGDIGSITSYLLASGKLRPPGPPPVAAPKRWQPAIEIFETELRSARQSDRTVALRVRTLITFALRHPGSDPRTVTRGQLMRYLATPSFSPSYAHSIRTTFRVFFGALEENGYREDNPATRLPKVRIPRSLPRPCPDGAIVHAIATADDPRVRLALKVAAETGLRRAEIAGLKRRDVEGWPGDYSLRVVGKGGHERTVPISDALAAALLAGDNIYVFAGATGHMTPDHLGGLIAKALPDNWTAHTLRHRFGSKAYQDSGDIRAVQELMGHQSPTTTAIYTQVNDSSRRKAAEAARIE